MLFPIFIAIGNLWKSCSLPFIFKNINNKEGRVHFIFLAAFNLNLTYKSIRYRKETTLNFYKKRGGGYTRNCRTIYNIFFIEIISSLAIICHNCFCKILGKCLALSTVCLILPVFCLVLPVALLDIILPIIKKLSGVAFILERYFVMYFTHIWFVDLWPHIFSNNAR